MRRGELLGLRWQDVDLIAGRLSVRQALISVRYELRVSEPKTAASRRSIHLDGRTVTALKAHRRRQLEERVAWGADWTDSGLVFTRENGEPLHPESVSHMFQKLAAGAGLYKIRFHDARHTFATAALRAGIHPKIVSEMLGHSSVAMTLDIYSHAVPALAEEAASRVADLILGQS